MYVLHICGSAYIYMSKEYIYAMDIQMHMKHTCVCTYIYTYIHIFIVNSRMFMN